MAFSVVLKVVFCKHFKSFAVYIFIKQNKKGALIENRMCVCVCECGTHEKANEILQATVICLNNGHFLCSAVLA